MPKKVGESRWVRVALGERWFDLMPGAKACAIHAVILHSLSMDSFPLHCVPQRAAWTCLIALRGEYGPEELGLSAPFCSSFCACLFTRRGYTHPENMSEMTRTF